MSKSNVIELPKLLKKAKAKTAYTNYPAKNCSSDIWFCLEHAANRIEDSILSQLVKEGNPKLFEERAKRAALILESISGDCKVKFKNLQEYILVRNLVRAHLMCEKKGGKRLTIREWNMVKDAVSSECETFYTMQPRSSQTPEELIIEAMIRQNIELWD